MYQDQEYQLLTNTSDCISNLIIPFKQPPMWEVAFPLPFANKNYFCYTCVLR